TSYIRAQAEKYRANGHQEIVLTGVNLGAYGRDRSPPGTLAHLLAELLPELGDLRLRLSSLDPRDLEDALIQQFAQHPNLCPYLHLSIQSGDDLILKRMGRDHGRQRVLEQIRKLREARPELLLGADMIVGFPTEERSAFQNTLTLVEEADITFLHVFRYSDRPGTPAAAIPRRFRVPAREIQWRSEQLRQKGASQLANTAKRWIGCEVQVLVETLQSDTAWGKTAHFLPVRLPMAADSHAGQRLTVHLQGFDPLQQTLYGQSLPAIAP
ncbi:MAG: radical SAM protein, partial [Magnetococcales bacterium]|nr:radical SAM protein [Magnetococcales bacterium]